jgi:hypothetical protein
MDLVQVVCVLSVGYLTILYQLSQLAWENEISRTREQAAFSGQTEDTTNKPQQEQSVVDTQTANLVNITFPARTCPVVSILFLSLFA